MTSIKGRNCCKFAKMTIYNSNVDLVNDVYTKFGRNKSIRSRDIEQKLNCDINQEPQLANLGKNDDLQSQRRSCQ